MAEIDDILAEMRQVLKAIERLEADRDSSA